MKKFLIFLIVLPLFAKAQDKPDESKWGIKFNGFVKTDIFYDNRQNINIREGHFLLYPDAILLDKNGVDLNAKPTFNMLSIQTRLKGTITGPEAFKAKTSGVVEADFFGNENASFSDVNGFRIRHAFVKINWKSTEILVGQYWHPMFIPESFPAVISFNTGAPFQPFSRNPQLRITQKAGPVAFTLTALMQRDFQSTGPDGSSTKYLRNAGIPNLDFQIIFKPDSTEHAFGIGVDYKILKPRLYSEIIVTKAKDTVINNLVVHYNAVTAKYDVNETVGGLSAYLFAKLKFKPLTVKLYGAYCQNATDLTMIGGYGVKQLTDAAIGKQDYLPLTTITSWLEINSNGKKLQYGVFCGYTKNMGASDSLKGTIYARNANIDYAYRVAPRIVFLSGKLNIAVESEYTWAFYGTQNGNGEGLPTKRTAVSNIRGLLAFIYNF